MVRHHYRIASAISLTLALAAAAPAAARPMPDPMRPIAPSGTNLCSEVCSSGGYTATTQSADPIAERGATLPHDPRPRAEVAALAASQSGSGATSAPRHAFSGPRSEVASGGGYSNTPTTVVRMVSPNTGFDWGDAGIGAGGAVLLMLLILGGALGVSSARRNATHSAA
jgi:hypothetical protein